jgi:hypothetical protein
MRQIRQHETKDNIPVKVSDEQATIPELALFHTLISDYLNGARTIQAGQKEAVDIFCFVECYGREMSSNPSFMHEYLFTLIECVVSIQYQCNHRTNGENCCFHCC